MKAIVFWGGVIGCMFSTAVWAQTGEITPLPAKMNGVFTRQIGELKEGARHIGSRKGGPRGVVPATLSCTDAEQVSAELTRWGIRHTVITPRVITAYIPPALADSVAALDAVGSIEGSMPGEAAMDKAVSLTGISKVHSGTGLESPFTGQGVVLGVIDQGFEYGHPAFSASNGQLRVGAVWNRYADNDPVTDAEEIKKLGNDGMNSNHGTHVGGIAGGTKKVIMPVTYRGNAPEAELVFFPSNLGDEEVLECVKYLKDYAAQQGKPCVVNMSFGSQGSTHDGRRTSAQALDELLGEGVIVVSSAGNDADFNMHARGTAGGNAAPMAVLVQPKAGEDLYVNFVSEQALGDYALRYFVEAYNTATGTSRNCTTAFEEQGRVSRWTDAGTKKVVMNFYHPQWQSFLQENEVICLKVATVNNAKKTFDAWIPLSRYGTFLATDNKAFASGDNSYGVDPQCRRSLVISSYINRKNYVAYGNGATYSWDWKVGDVSSFSSVGPLVGEWIPMPLISAPGSGIISAYGKQIDGFDPETNISVTNGVRFNNEWFYYGVMSGTSMSAPQVTGIIACWLQAYPKLTPEEAVEIIRMTAKSDAFTGDLTDSWDAKWGYGKIDAYEGLKECIRRASTDAVVAAWDTREPLTWNKTPEKWQILFNNPESQARISVLTADGKEVLRRELGDVPAAHEEVIGLQSLPKGMYLISVKTAGYVQSKKFIK